MGNKLYVDSSPSQIEDIITFDLTHLPKPPSEDTNITSDDSTQHYQHLNLWAFSSNDSIEEDNNTSQITSKGIELKSINEEHFLLSSSEVYILLLIFKDKESVIEQSPFPTGLWGIIESSSNMTPRGLMYAFPTNNSQNLESFLLSKRVFENSEYKYMLFIWNGKKASPLLRSTALMKAFDLDKKLLNTSIIPFIYHGYHFQEGNKITNSTIVKLNDFINNTVENKEDEMTPSSEKMSDYHETVYLLKWLYPIKKSEKKKKEKIFFKNFNKNFVHSGNTTDFYDNFQYVEIANKGNVMSNFSNRSNNDVEEEDDGNEGEDYDDIDGSFDDMDADLNKEMLGQNKNAKGVSMPIQLSKINMNNIHGIKPKENPLDKLKIPKLMVIQQHNTLNDDLISERSKRRAEEEESFEEIPKATIDKVSESILKEKGMKIDLSIPIALGNNDKDKDREEYNNGSCSNRNNYYQGNSSEVNNLLVINPSDEKCSIDALNENYDIKDSDRKKVIDDYYSKKFSEIIPDFLFLSSYNAAKNKSLMEKHKITHIINCAADFCTNVFASDPQYTYLSFFCKDHGTENIECLFYECSQFIEKAKENKGKVLVHCIQGVSRSVSIIIAYLILNQQMRYDAAFNFVQTKRPIAGPNFGFSIQLEIFYQRLYEPAKSYRYKPKIFACGSFQKEQPEKIVCRLIHEPFYELKANSPPRKLDKRGIFIICDIDKIYIWIGAKVSSMMKEEYLSTCYNYVKLIQKYERGEIDKDSNEYTEHPPIEVREGEEPEEFFELLLLSKEKMASYRNAISDEFPEWNNWYKELPPKQESVQPLNTTPLQIQEMKKGFFIYPNTEPDFVFDYEELCDNIFLLACVSGNEENVMYKWKGSTIVLEDDVCEEYVQKVIGLFFGDKAKNGDVIQKEEIPTEESDEFMNLL